MVDLARHIFRRMHVSTVAVQYYSCTAVLLARILLAIALLSCIVKLDSQSARQPVLTKSTGTAKAGCLRQGRVQTLFPSALVALARIRSLGILTRTGGNLSKRGDARNIL